MPADDLATEFELMTAQGDVSLEFDRPVSESFARSVLSALLAESSPLALSHAYARVSPSGVDVEYAARFQQANVTEQVFFRHRQLPVALIRKGEGR